VRKEDRNKCKNSEDECFGPNSTSNQERVESNREREKLATRISTKEKRKSLRTAGYGLPTNAKKEQNKTKETNV